MILLREFKTKTDGKSFFLNGHSTKSRTFCYHMTKRSKLNKTWTFLKLLLMNNETSLSKYTKIITTELQNQLNKERSKRYLTNS